MKGEWIHVRTLVMLLVAPTLAAQQVPDSGFAPPIARPTFAAGSGPVVMIDAAHHNLHTADRGFLPFATLLRRDGYVLRAGTEPFTAGLLRDVEILVIANPLHRSNTGGRWFLPTPSAFTAAEIAAVRQWVERGGALLLIADHMPFPGGAAALAAAFGADFPNGFALDSATADGGNFAFRRMDGSLADHAITRGLFGSDRVDSVRSFTGNAFTWPGATPILTLGSGTAVFLPDTAWQFHAATPRRSGQGMLQGAVRPVGEGRVALFGEAAMFTGQLVGPRRLPMGMNAPGAPQNVRFVLNLVRWLAGSG